MNAERGGNRSVAGKFFLMIIPLLVVSTVVIVLFEIRQHHYSTRQELGEKLSILLDSHRSILAKPLWNVDAVWGQQILDSVLLDPDVSGAVIFDDNNEVFSSGGSLSGLSHEMIVGLLNEIRQRETAVADGVSIRALMGRTPDSILENLLAGETEVVFLTDSNLEYVGSLAVVLTDKYRSTRFTEQLRYKILTILIFSSLILVSTLLMFHRSIYVPLKKLHGAFIAIREGGEHDLVHWKNDDEIGRAIAAFNDLQSQQLRAQKALKDSEEMFKALFEQTGGYSLVLQPTESGIPTILNANSAACGAHGYSRSEMIGRPVSDLDDEEGKRLCRQRTRYILSGKNLNIENIHVRKDGSTFPVAVYANVVEFDDKPPLIISTEFDITERKRAEEERQELEKRLQQKQKMEAIGTLAGGIAHDFNNLLSVVVGYAEMTHEDVEPDSELSENMEEILEAAHRGKELIKQVLAFSSQDKTERIVLHPANCIKEAIKLLRSSLPATINIDVNIDDDVGPVYANPAQLNQIVMNLCTNAFHSMEETGGNLTISLEQHDYSDLEIPADSQVQPGHYVQMSITDTGSGIAPEIRGRMFEPYFTTKEFGKGTGMGLSIVHGIVENYRGFITVDSCVNSGSTINVHIPVTDKVFARQQVAADNEEVGQGRILFVDDEERIVKVAKSMLVRAGYDVTGQPSSREALQLVENDPHQFDLVITDYTMPDLTGLELAEQILRLRPDIPIILCTGYPSGVTEDVIKAKGIGQLATKPVAKRDLLKMIQKVLN